MWRLHWRRVRSKYPWLQMIQSWRGWLLITFTLVLISYALFSYQRRPVAYMEQEIREAWLGNIHMDFRTGLFVLKDKAKGTVFMRGSIPDAQQMGDTPSHCARYNASKALCAEWYPYSRLEVGHTSDEHAECETFRWITISGNYGRKFRPQTCFSMADFQWFGGSLLSKQTWPLNKASVPMQPYVTHDLEMFQGQRTVIGNVQDWFWINSGGVAVMLESKVPVQVSVNQSDDKLLCFYSLPGNTPALRYKVCKAGNLRKIHRYVISKMVDLPVAQPNEGYFTKPLWSSWPMLNYPTQSNVMAFAKDVVDKSFSRYSFELHDETMSLFMTDYFDKTRYPNLQQMMMHMHGDYGFKAHVSISPYVAEKEYINKTKLLLDARGEPLITIRNGEHWNMLNLLKSDVLQEVIEKAKALQQLCSLDGFRLIGGEAQYLPRDLLSIPEKDTYAKNFLSISKHFSVGSVMSTFGYNSQHHSMLTLLSSSTSSWDEEGGLQTIIPSALNLGILGYPYVVPNVVGGPGIKKEVNATYTQVIKPDRELYIRWMGVSAYMPVMMFSFPPWLYDQDVEDMAHAFVKIHEETVGPLVVKAAREYEISGSPIVRPLWWLDPTDPTLTTIDDEYMLGDSLLVAPILLPGAETRDIYIPAGRWRDELRGRELDGRTWQRSVKVPLNKVATFLKVSV